MLIKCSDFADKFNTCAPEKCLIDVRNSDETSQGILAKAIHIPLPELAEKYSEIPVRKNIFIYCRSGKRAAAAAEFLEKNGFSNIFVAADGGFDQLKNIMEVAK